MAIGARARAQVSNAEACSAAIGAHGRLSKMKAWRGGDEKRKREGKQRINRREEKQERNKEKGIRVISFFLSTMRSRFVKWLMKKL